MPSRASKKKPDFAEIAFRVVQEATGQRERTEPRQPAQKPDPATASAAAAALSALGASKGGKARAASLSKRRRKAIAHDAAVARWSQRTTKRR